MKPVMAMPRVPGMFGRDEWNLAESNETTFPCSGFYSCVSMNIPLALKQDGFKNNVRKPSRQ